MVRPGEHVTILTYSRMRYHVMQATKTLVNKGYDPEVIDIRSPKPFDLYNIGKSAKRTHRVLIVEECMRTGGIGASLRAAIIDNFWDYLDAPIMCLSSQDVPIPNAGTLEGWTVVQPDPLRVDKSYRVSEKQSLFSCSVSSYPIPSSRFTFKKVDILQNGDGDEYIEKDKHRTSDNRWARSPHSVARAFRDGREKCSYGRGVTFDCSLGIDMRPHGNSYKEIEASGVCLVEEEEVTEVVAMNEGRETEIKEVEGEL
ncbi:pyruvate dehydrogenase E1 component subunit [Musa troglodytarum]|uniref:pyruvate dehydrogenase (acetyl-transferring) n=1 Tax=Musa troglodytarum TaxID=320322 RepID=A0A9E7FH50_9LILI|nr:pyruvate dehydrogenase E1 component subunit [Musa troglodytarum]